MTPDVSNRSRVLLGGVFLVVILAVFFRFYHLDFGLPHSFHADEPEFTEFAIKYTYELRNVIAENNWYKLVPISYVYGTFPIYVLTAFTMVFSKFHGITGLAFEKTDLFIFMRWLVAAVSLVLLVVTPLIYKKIFPAKENEGSGVRQFLNVGVLTTLFLVALNWKLIVHAHYVNADIILTVLFMLATLSAFKYFDRPADTKFTILAAVFFGLALGTKVTALLSAPLFVYLFLAKKDLRGLAAFLSISFGIFMVTNPWAMIFGDNFGARIFAMFSKEGGLVFDSVDTRPHKYLEALSFMATPIVFAFSVLGATIALREKRRLPFQIFLVGNIVLYLVFYSLQSRLVDRWLLPIIPFVLVYAAYGFTRLSRTLSAQKLITPLVGVAALLLYVRFPILLLSQFDQNTPKSAAYLWAKQNISPETYKLVITEEGLDPMNKLRGSTDVKRFEVYETEGAYLSYPPNPLIYDYVVLSSKPMTYFKRPEIAEKYPQYVNRWYEFETAVTASQDFELIKEFALPKPNLVNLSDVRVYRRVGIRATE